jgi:CMP-N-acetylneuraminic acid synthetase
MKDVLFLILARSGSKGVPDKNIYSLGDLPLIAFRILTAKKTKLSYDLVVSTDSNEYATIASKYGARAPFLRPANLASDSAKSSDACMHAIEWLEENEGAQWKYLCLLEPTSPFTKIDWIEEAIQKIDLHKVSSIVACRHVSPHPAFIQDEDEFLTKISTEIMNQNNLNRQNFNKQITPSGNFYISTIDNFKKTKSFYNIDTMSFIVPEPFSLEIDSPMDLEWAKFLMEKKFITKEMLGI